MCVTPSMIVSSSWPSRRCSSVTVIVEKRRCRPSSAALSTTPLRQPWAQTKISWHSGTSMPTCTMVQSPRAGGEYSRPCLKGTGQCASESFAVGAGSTRSGVCAKSRSMGGPQNVKPPRAGSGLVAAQASTRRRASSR